MSSRLRRGCLVAMVYLGQSLRWFVAPALLTITFVWTLDGAFITSSSTAGEFFATVLGRGALGLLASTLVTAVGAWMYFESAKRVQPSAWTILANDPRPPVVYFRSFGQDLHQAKAARRMFPVPLLAQPPETAEQAMGRMLEEVGPLVAIGQPGEVVAPVALGFSRLYVSNEEWQREANTLLRDAAVLVFVVGTSEGVLWEIRRAFSVVNASKMVMLICGTDGFESFRQWMKDQLGIGLPSLEPRIDWFRPGGIDAIFTFDEAGRPTLHQPKFPEVPKGGPILDRYISWSPIHAQVDGFLLEALGTVLRRHGIVRTDPRLPYSSRKPLRGYVRWAHRTLVFGVSILVGAAVLTLIYLSLVPAADLPQLLR